jgi:Asp-tRNA(Asn)/Glu-tRNA(Gln) amidotransferase A subunit family amidase
MSTKKDPAAQSLGRRGGKQYAANHTKEERREAAARAGRGNKGKPKKPLAPRCYCGKNTRHTAGLRAFACCKKAGIYPSGKRVKLNS